MTSTKRVLIIASLLFMIPSISFAERVEVEVFSTTSSDGVGWQHTIPKGAIVSLYAKGGAGSAGGGNNYNQVGGGGGGGACAHDSTADKYILCVGGGAGGGGGSGGSVPGIGGAGGSTAGDGVGRGGGPYPEARPGYPGTKNGAGGGIGSGGPSVPLGGAPGYGGKVGALDSSSIFYTLIHGYDGGGGGALFRPGGVSPSSSNYFGASKNIFTSTYLGGGNGCKNGGGGGGGYGGGGGGSIWVIPTSGGGGSSFFHDKLSPPDANGYVSLPASVTESTISLYTGLGGMNTCGTGYGTAKGGDGTITLKYSCDSKYGSGFTSCQSTVTNSCGDTTSGTVNCDGSCSATAPAERPPVSCPLYSYNVCGGQSAEGSGLVGCISTTCIGTPPATPPTAPPSVSASVVSTTYAYDSSGVTFNVSGTTACSSITITQYAAYWQDTDEWEYNTSGIFTHYINAPPDTYKYAFYAKDSTDKWVSPSQWSTVTLTAIPCNPANVCGQTNTGVLLGHTNGSDGTCSVSAPSNTTCAPSAPTISGLFKDGVNRKSRSFFSFGASVPAYDSLGYQIYANATSLIPGAKLTYYFEWGIMSADGTINWSADPPKWATLPLP